MGDDLRGGVLLWRLLKYKYESSLGAGGKQAVTLGGVLARNGGASSCLLDVRRILKVLHKRFNTKDLRKIPPCALRYTLIKIWGDVPPTRVAVLTTKSVGVSTGGAAGEKAAGEKTGAAPVGEKAVVSANPFAQQLLRGMGGGGAREVVSAEEEGIVLSRGSSSQLADAGPHSSCLPWWLVSS